MRKVFFSISILFLIFSNALNIHATENLKLLSCYDIKDDINLISLPDTKRREEVKKFLEMKDNEIGVITRYQLNFSEPLTHQKILSEVTQVSKLVGLKYYSNDLRKKKILFKKIYTVQMPTEKQKKEKAITNPSKLIPQNDPKFPEKEDSLSFFFFQDENLFHQSLWESTIINNKDYIFLTYKNISPLKFGIFTTIKPEIMKMAFIIIPTENGCIIEAVIASELQITTFLREKIKRSLGNRLHAISCRLMNLLTMLNYESTSIKDCQSF